MSYTASDLFLDCLLSHGISHLFANFGSDHPGLIEAIAKARAKGAKIPRIITCPNEMVGMSAAHGFWQASGIAQAVIAHVECGTQALAGAVHNAAKGRAAILIFAGSSPFTQDGELKGSRNEFIQWIQDVHDQRGIVRGYVKYDNELRTGRNLHQILRRAMQFSYSDPKGPVYLMGAREVMEETLTPLPAAELAPLPQLAPTALAMSDVETIGRKLMAAERPLIVTSYLGRKPEAVTALTSLCERLGIGVLDSVPNWVNFSHQHPLYQGNQWNEPQQNEALNSADLVLVIDSDVPWIPTLNRPAAGVPILHIDVDPLKEQMPLWQISPEASYRADAATALTQIETWLATQPNNREKTGRRAQHWSALHYRHRAKLETKALVPLDNSITPDHFLSRLRLKLDEDCLIVSEGISNYQPVLDQLAPTRAGTLFASGGGSLGYNGGAAIGVKLARPDSTVIALTGDGSYMFSIPSSVHWMARRYKTPFLQIIFNNGGWKSPKLSALAVHPNGAAAASDDIDVSFEPASDYGAIAAAAGGAWHKRLKIASDIDSVIDEALKIVRHEQRCAVIEVILALL
jgi:acetolactate synthase-1/2/3 large subunit